MRVVREPTIYYRRVVLESPFQGGKIENMVYARKCLEDSLKRGEAPLASHLLYPQVLDDATPKDRERGMGAGHAWIFDAEALVVYTDLGITPGMHAGIERALAEKTPVEYRQIL